MLNEEALVWIAAVDNLNNHITSPSITFESILDDY
jgi:hypothetical protein